MILTEQHLKQLRSVGNGYSKQQIRKMKTLTDRGFKSLVGKEVSERDYEILLNYRNNKTAAKKSKTLNKMSQDKGSWEWKPKPQDIPPIKRPTTKQKIKAKRRAKGSKPDKEFYLSREWRALRHDVLDKYKGACLLCGRTYRDHGVIIHVDHIKPKSKYPELALDANNLQLLCEDCNLGKGNRYETDWRPKKAEEPWDFNALTWLTKDYI